MMKALYMSIVLIFSLLINEEPFFKDFKMNEKKEIAILANGCFWCTEAIFQQLKGVHKVEPGYIGGIKENPTYKEVCTGETLHAEALRIEYNPEVITYTELLEVFFSTHNPTTLNRQGNDVGTQYRSEIFYLNEEQKSESIAFIDWMSSQEIFADPIVTKVTEATHFWEAEDYHHNYYINNPNQSYCAAVVGPKVEKFKKNFETKLK